MAEELPPEEENEELDPEALAAELDLGIELSPEEKAEADKMVAHLRSQFGLDGAPADGGEEEPQEPAQVEGEPEPVPTPTPEPATPSSTSDVIRIDGRDIPLDEARSLMDLRNYLAAHPEKATEVRRVIEGQVEPPKPPEPVAPPEWLDQDDPAQVAMWTRQQELEARLNSIGATQAQSQKEQAVARAQADANAGISTFRAAHPELSEDDITTLRTHAVSLDIIDGLSRTRSGPDAVLKALDIAYLDHPEYRARVLEQPTPTEKRSAAATSRKGKLNALAGTSGSAPRNEAPVKPTTDREMRSAAAKWLSEQGIL